MDAARIKRPKDFLRLRDEISRLKACRGKCAFSPGDPIGHGSSPRPTRK